MSKPDKTTIVHCAACQTDVAADRITGKIAYPHRPDLKNKPLWQCPLCDNFVGCHKGTDKPLGVIVSKEVKAIRVALHNLIDPVWKTKKLSRKEVYRALSKVLGYEYHTGNITNLSEAVAVCKAAESLGWVAQQEAKQ